MIMYQVYTVSPPVPFQPSLRGGIGLPENRLQEEERDAKKVGEVVKWGK